MRKGELMRSMQAIFFLLLVSITSTDAQTSTAPASYAPLSINNLFNYYGNNGDGSYNFFSPSHEGFEFYKGTGKCMFNEDGVVWGGYHKGRSTPKVGGSAVLHALQPGPIIAYGTATHDPIAADPSSPSSRIYRVRST
jgi:hypothetical protein